MKNKFKGTEGEWFLDDTSRNYNIAVVTEEKTIAIISDDNRLSDDEIEANAKLLVTSRELLEVVSELHKLLCEHEPDWYLKYHYNIAKKVLDKVLS